MLAGVWGLYYGFGLTVASMAPLVEPIVTELDLSLSTMGAVLGAWPLVYIVTALPAGAAVDRFGVRRALAAASLVIALSGLARALAVDDLTLFLAVALFGVGGPLVSIGAPKVIAEWFDDEERGTAMGIYITGPALGGITALALTNAVAMPALGGSWRAVLALYAGIVLALGVAWLVLSARAGPNVPDVQSRRERPWAVFRALLQRRSVRLVLAMSVGIFFYNHGLNNWLPEILKAAGKTPAEAGYWASLPTVVGIAGSLVIPRLATRERRRALLLALFAGAAVATVLLQASADALLGAGLVLQGIARSSMMTIAILALMEDPEVGAARTGAAGGLFFSAAEIGGVLGPLSVGVAADLSGAFAAPLWMLTAVCAGLIVLGGFLGERRPG